MTRRPIRAHAGAQQVDRKVRPLFLLQAGGVALSCFYNGRFEGATAASTLFLP